MKLEDVKGSEEYYKKRHENLINRIEMFVDVVTIVAAIWISSFCLTFIIRNI